MEILPFCPESGGIHCVQITPEKEQRRCGERVRATYRRTVWLPDRADHRVDGRILLDPPVRGSDARHDTKCAAWTLSRGCPDRLPVPGQ